jgi:hypothetical protein
MDLVLAHYRMDLLPLVVYRVKPNFQPARIGTRSGCIAGRLEVRNQWSIDSVHMQDQIKVTDLNALWKLHPAGDRGERIDGDAKGCSSRLASQDLENSSPSGRVPGDDRTLTSRSNHRPCDPSRLVGSSQVVCHPVCLPERMSARDHHPLSIDHLQQDPFAGLRADLSGFG